MGKTTINMSSVPESGHVCLICLFVWLSVGLQQLSTCCLAVGNFSASERATQSKRIHIRNISDDLKINIGPNNWTSLFLSRFVRHSVCLSVCRFVCLPICSSVCLSVRLFVPLPAWPSGQPIYLLTRGQCSQFFDCLTNWLTSPRPLPTPHTVAISASCISIRPSVPSSCCPVCSAFAGNKPFESQFFRSTAEDHKIMTGNYLRDGIW